MTAAGVLARVPGVLLLAPLLAVGALLPGVGHPPAELTAGSVGMRHEAFGQRAVAVRCGDRLRLQNTSRWVHIIGTGSTGMFTTNPHSPVKTRALLQTDQSVTTGSWQVPGPHRLTCAVHPEMNLTVIVADCSRPAAG